MQQVPLAVVPNQKFSIRLDNVRYVIQIQKTENVMCATIQRNGITVLSGQRCLPNTALIPYKSVEDEQGNFVFVTQLGALPDYLEFGKTQFLYFATNAEIQAARNGG